VVTHLWISVCTEHLIIPSVGNAYLEIFEIAINYLGIGREVILERFQTLK
jgi:hypothetical protein